MEKFNIIIVVVVCGYFSREIHSLTKKCFFNNSLGLLTLPSSVIFDKVELVQYFIFKIAAKTAPQSDKKRKWVFAASHSTHYSNSKT